MSIKSDAQRRAVAKYKAKVYDQIQLRVPAGYRDTIKAHAESKGMSVNGYIIELIEKDMRETK